MDLWQWDSVRGRVFGKILPEILDSLPWPWLFCQLINFFFFRNSQAPLKGKRTQNQAQPNLLPQNQHLPLRLWTQTVQGPQFPLLKFQSSWMQVSLNTGSGVGVF